MGRGLRRPGTWNSESFYHRQPVSRRTITEGSSISPSWDHRSAVSDVFSALAGEGDANSHTHRKRPQHQDSRGGSLVHACSRAILMADSGQRRYIRLIRICHRTNFVWREARICGMVWPNKLQRRDVSLARFTNTVVCREIKALVHDIGIVSILSQLRALEQTPTIGLHSARIRNRRIRHGCAVCARPMLRTHSHCGDEADP